MAYPNYKNKHLEKALFHPGDYLEHKNKYFKKFPEKIIITYQTQALNYLKRKFKGKYEKMKFYSLLTVYSLKKENIGFIKMTGVGAPNAGGVMEELISLGAKKILNIGIAGGLIKEGIFLCDRAIRDEGTSHHYLPKGKYSYPNKKLTQELGKSMKRKGLGYDLGTTWTIDAPYRETKKEIEHYRKEGVATVEMEASALFAIAKVRKVKIASAFVISDTLIKEWNPKFNHIDVIKSQNKLMDAAIDCLRRN